MWTGFIHVSKCYIPKNTKYISMKFYWQVVHKTFFGACEYLGLLQVILHIKMKENSVLLFFKKFPIYNTFILFTRYS